MGLVAQYGKHGTGPELEGVTIRHERIILLPTLKMFETLFVSSEESVDSLRCDLRGAWALFKLAFCTAAGVLVMKREVRQN